MNQEFPDVQAGFFIFHWSQQVHLSNNPREKPTHGHHRMIYYEIRLIMFFAAKEGEALYSQLKKKKKSKRDLKKNVVQIFTSLLQNSNLY